VVLNAQIESHDRWTNLETLSVGDRICLAERSSPIKAPSLEKELGGRPSNGIVAASKPFFTTTNGAG